MFHIWSDLTVHRPGTAVYRYIYISNLVWIPFLLLSSFICANKKPSAEQGAKTLHEDSTVPKSLHTAPTSQSSTAKMTRSKEDQRRQSMGFATSKSRRRTRTGSISIDVSESRTQLTEKRVRPLSRRSSRMRREESSKMKSVMTQRDDATLKSLNIRQQSRVVAVEPTLTMQAVKDREIKQRQVKPNEIKLREIKDIEELMKLAGTQEEEIITLTRLDEDSYGILLCKDVKDGSCRT
ncbi:hypothetical protein GCK32_006887 [Trichostrongylus colubriformis]|uniref:Uncharacterized protein n=1 Tax=Trichostrongylus colubriformis TaxID=6319 RepID=A0AAN8IPP8_TRICO